MLLHVGKPAVQKWLEAFDCAFDERIARNAAAALRARRFAMVSHVAGPLGSPSRDRLTVRRGVTARRFGVHVAWRACVLLGQGRTAHSVPGPRIWGCSRNAGWVLPFALLLLPRRVGLRIVILAMPLKDWSLGVEHERRLSCHPGVHPQVRQVFAVDMGISSRTHH